jgi:hypothetical protein
LGGTKNAQNLKEGFNPPILGFGNGVSANTEVRLFKNGRWSLKSRLRNRIMKEEYGY